MAIIIHEEKKRINWFSLGSIIFIISVIGAVIYYLFFAEIPLIERVAPPKFQSLKSISSLELNPAEIRNSPKFQILRPYFNQIEIGPKGRLNPFLPPK